MQLSVVAVAVLLGAWLCRGAVVVKVQDRQRRQTGGSGDDGSAVAGVGDGVMEESSVVRADTGERGTLGFGNETGSAMRALDDAREEDQDVEFESDPGGAEGVSAPSNLVAVPSKLSPPNTTSLETAINNAVNTNVATATPATDTTTTPPSSSETTTTPTPLLTTAHSPQTTASSSLRQPHNSTSRVPTSAPPATTVNGNVRPVGNLIYSLWGFILGGVLTYFSLSDTFRVPLIQAVDTWVGHRSRRRRQTQEEGLQAYVSTTFIILTNAIDRINAIADRINKS